MYPEFIIIYVLLAIILGLLVGVIVLLIKNGKSNQGYSAPNVPPVSSVTPITNTQPMATPAQNQSTVSSTGGVVFCKKCAKTYSSDQNFCPNCGTPRS